MCAMPAGTALTKRVRPVASVSAAANPRVNPPPALRTRTGSPVQPAMAARTCAGRSSHEGRTAVAS